MNKTAVLLGTTALAAVLAAPGTADAQNSNASSKAVAGVTDALVLNLSSDASTDGSADLMTLRIKTANQKDLFVNVAIQCGLTTTTKVVNETQTTNDTTKKSGREAKVSSASADAGVDIRVVVPGYTTHPNSNGGWVTFCQRSQELEAILGQALVCNGDINTTDGGVTLQEECDLTDQEIQLTLDTLSTHSFNFIIPDVGSGNHLVTVKARGHATAESSDPSAGTLATATAILGLGSVTIEEVRMVKDTQVDVDL